MGTYALHAAHFVLPSQMVEDGYLTVADGKFGSWSPERPEMDIVELGDAFVSPGIVDTHIHGFFGHATTDCDAEGINEASLELAKRGTTAWLPTTFTDSVENIAQQCASIHEAVTERPDNFMGARIPGIYLEGPFFTEKHKGAQNPKYLVPPSYAAFKRWQKSAEGMIVKSALAAEYDEAESYIEKLAAEGIVCAIGHSDATFAETMRAVRAGATCFVHTYNGMRGLHHREPGVVGAAMVSKDTYAELISDGHHVVPGACEALIRAKGWEHVVPITDCLACGGLPEGEYMSGGLPVVLKDSLCYLLNDDGTTGNIAGSILTLAEGVKNLVSWGIVSPEQALRMASEVAARSAHIEGTCGFILPGRRADFNVFGPDMALRATYLAGAKVEA